MCIAISRARIWSIHQASHAYPTSDPGSRRFLAELRQALGPNCNFDLISAPRTKIDKDVRSAFAPSSLRDPPPNFNDLSDQFDSITDMAGHRLKFESAHYREGRNIVRRAKRTSSRGRR